MNNLRLWKILLAIGIGFVPVQLVLWWLIATWRWK